MSYNNQSSDAAEVPDCVMEAIREVLDYLWKDEFADYLETSPQEGREDHVFIAMRLVDRWLARHERARR